jgi:hypothetical protein
MNHNHVNCVIVLHMTDKKQPNKRRIKCTKEYKDEYSNIKQSCRHIGVARRCRECMCTPPPAAKCTPQLAVCKLILSTVFHELTNM